MTKKAVRYGIVPKKTSGNEIIQIDFRTLLLETKATKKYYNLTPFLMKLSKCAILIWEFAVEQMDKENIVKNDTKFKSRFNEMLTEVDLKPYENNTINKGFKDLVEADLAYRKDKRGYYEINPIFIFKGSEEERVKKVRKWVERPFDPKLTIRRKQLLDQMEQNEKD